MTVAPSVALIVNVGNGQIGEYPKTANGSTYYTGIVGYMWPVRSGECVLDAQCLASFLKQLGAVGAAVVGQQALDGHAQRLVVSHSGFEEVHHRLLSFVAVHLHEARS